MIVDYEHPENEVYCTRKRCSRFLCELVEDGQAIEIGNVRIWHVATLCCVKCNRPYRFEPKNIDAGLYDSLELEKEFNF